MGPSLELNCFQGRLQQVPAPRAGVRGASHPTTRPRARAWDREAGGTHSPVWIMICLDRSPTFTKALLHTLHL